MSSPLRIVNCADLVSPTWGFLEGRVPSPPQQWRHHNGNPTNRLERRIRKPAIARVRGCAQAALTARSWPADVVVTHLPKVSATYALAARAVGARAKHLAFSFNLTNLPGRAGQLAMSRAFQDVHRFVVFASAERALYSRYFGLDPARIDMIRWAMDPPQARLDTRMVQSSRYLCSVGGEARDYRSVMQLARRLPAVPFVVVARAYAVVGLDVPDNVTVLTDVPNWHFWNVVAHAEAVLLPLRDAETNCGHISLVGAMQLGTPIVTTRSAGTSDYVYSEHNALVAEPGDVDGLAEATMRLYEDRPLAERLGTAGQCFAAHACAPQRWQDYWAAYLADDDAPLPAAPKFA